MDNIFYVYQYLREDGSPYYVGKGKRDRMFSHHKKISVPKDKNRIKIVAENLSEQDAFDLEIKLIKEYGRKDLGTGILRNMSDGGTGISNPSIEARKKMSDNVKNGITGMKNKTHTDATKRKMSETKKIKGLSEEHLQALRIANSKKKGRKECPDVGKKRGEAISKAKKGKTNGREGFKHSEETKIKISAQKGWKHTEEAKKIMSDIQREKCHNMTDEERKQRYGHCAGKPWSEARRAAYLLNKEKKNGWTPL